MCYDTGTNCGDLIYYNKNNYFLFIKGLYFYESVDNEVNICLTDD